MTTAISATLTGSDNMSESQAMSPLPTHVDNDDETARNNTINSIAAIPTEIVSEEEMALMEAALAAAAATTRCSLASSATPSFSSPFRINARSLHSITLLSKRKLSGRTEPDLEDFGQFQSREKQNEVRQSFYQRFRRKRGVSVTDLTSAEWCEKQMEFSLTLQPRKINKAMKAGIARHQVLEEEVVKRVRVLVESDEDRWALKLSNFIGGVNQLLFEGLTRELPVIGFTGGVWIIGVVDEIRMLLTETDGHPMIVDTKTRASDTLPAEPQRRNGKLQLMIYKYLWDKLVAESFPSAKFFEFFSLNPHQILSKEIRENTISSGFPAKTLDDVVTYYINTCRMLPLAHNQLLLRYELQKDCSLLWEDEFAYDSVWLENQLETCLQFWVGNRESLYTPEEEQWKCRYCQFAPVCQVNTDPDGRSSPERTNSNHGSRRADEETCGSCAGEMPTSSALREAIQPRHIAVGDLVKEKGMQPCTTVSTTELECYIVNEDKWRFSP